MVSSLVTADSEASLKQDETSSAAALSNYIRNELNIVHEGGRSSSGFLSAANPLLAEKLMTKS